MRKAPHKTLNYATPEARTAVRAALRTGGGFAVLAMDFVFALWFWKNYFRIGPERLELVVLLMGWTAIAVVAGFAFVQLIRGIKALPSR